MAWWRWWCGVDAKAEADYYREMFRTTQEAHTVGSPKAPPEDDGTRFNMRYDGAGELADMTGSGYSFEIQRDAAGRMRRVIAKPL